MAFTVATIGKLMRLDHEDLRHGEAVKERFIILTRLTIGGGYLMLADAGPTGAGLSFPTNARAVVLGALNWVDDRGRQRFALKATIPENIEFSARFLPANGWLSLWLSAGVPEIEGRLTFQSSSCDHETKNRFSTWSFTGHYFPWEGELLSPEGGFGL